MFQYPHIVYYLRGLARSRHNLKLSTMPMKAKFSSSVTCHEGDPLIKSHDPLIAWPTKSIISPLSQCL